MVVSLPLSDRIYTLNISHKAHVRPVYDTVWLHRYFIFLDLPFNWTC